MIRENIIYLVLRKPDKRFLLFNNNGTLEFLEAQGKPKDVSWKDFVSIILQNKYAFPKETVNRIEIVEPLFTYENGIYVYVEVKRVRFDNPLFYSLSYPFMVNKSMEGNLSLLSDVKLNLEMLNLW